MHPRIGPPGHHAPHLVARQLGRGVLEQGLQRDARSPAAAIRHNRRRRIRAGAPRRSPQARAGRNAHARSNASAAIAGRPGRCTRSSRSAPSPQATSSSSSNVHARLARSRLGPGLHHLQGFASQLGPSAGPGHEPADAPVQLGCRPGPVEPAVGAGQLGRVGDPPLRLRHGGRRFGQGAQDQPGAKLGQLVVQSGCRRLAARSGRNRAAASARCRARPPSA